MAARRSHLLVLAIGVCLLYGCANTAPFVGLWQFGNVPSAWEEGHPPKGEACRLDLWPKGQGYIYYRKPSGAVKIMEVSCYVKWNLHNNSVVLYKTDGYYKVQGPFVGQIQMLADDNHLDLVMPRSPTHLILARQIVQAD